MTRFGSLWPTYERRGRDSNPRSGGNRTPVFKTGAFDRSATPPGSAQAILALHSRQHPGEVAEWLKALAC
jgi:hypothetical protein